MLGFSPLAAAALADDFAVSGVPNHALTGSSIATGAPTVGSSEIVQPASVLTGELVAAGSPQIGSATLQQVHLIGCDGVVSGSPACGVWRWQWEQQYDTTTMWAQQNDTTTTWTQQNDTTAVWTRVA